jgi:hypothetical protein
MTACCTTSGAATGYPTKHTCPVNGLVYGKVSRKTIMHHLFRPWDWVAKEQGYYFCDDPACDVVYFGQDDSIINKSSLRTVVGIKEQSTHAPLCYCFGINKQESVNNPEAKAFVIEQTKSGSCSCATSNPSGRCCLKDFPKPSCLQQD